MLVLNFDNDDEQGGEQEDWQAEAGTPDTAKLFGKELSTRPSPAWEQGLPHGERS